MGLDRATSSGSTLSGWVVSVVRLDESTGAFLVVSVTGTEVETNPEVAAFAGTTLAGGACAFTAAGTGLPLAGAFAAVFVWVGAWAAFAFLCATVFAAGFACAFAGALFTGTAFTGGVLDAGFVLTT